MIHSDTNPSHRDNESNRQPEDVFGTAMGCCGQGAADWKEMMGRCPMTSLSRGAKVLLFGALTTAGFLFLLAVTGWALGVLAFFRTL